MIDIHREGILLSTTKLEFENEGVLNPAVIRIDDSVHMFYRAVRTGNNSTIGYCKLDGPLNIAERWQKPILVPEEEYEIQGIEDPRIVKIDDLYYMTYTAYDGLNALGALFTSKDLITFKRAGVIVPLISYAEFVFLIESDNKLNDKYYHNHKFYYQDGEPEKKMLLWDKNVIFFPRRINGNLVFLHRIRPGIQVVMVKELAELTKEFWNDYFLHFADHILMDPDLQYESSYIGGGCPPIETEYGWVLIYHGVEETKKGLVYSACAAALLDINDPRKVIARLPYALFSPVMEWERRGEVNNVVFPTGTALFGDTLFIYYGAADTHIASVSLSFSSLVNELLIFAKRHE
jgi:predicted GH43/DUF377 family glycosyl hydrolase